MWTRRQFLSRGVGLGVGLAAGGLALRAVSDEVMPDGGQARGMINRPAQEAIDMGLAYLAREQHADGSFGTGQHRGNVAITSLGGLAMMAGGHQPGRGRYGQIVTRALQFVLDQEQRVERPGFLHNRNAILHGPMYGHGFGTLFLAEAHGMVNNRELRARLRGTLERAVQLIINTQNNEDPPANSMGGWRYHPQRQDADISVTICQIMALRAARNAGIAVPRAVADKCTRYVKACQDLRGDGGFRYMRGGGPTGFARTAAGVVALYSAGVYKDESVTKGLDYLINRCRPGNPNQGNFFNRQDMLMHYYYGHYYAVQAMWTAGGRYWTTWYPLIRDELVNHRDRNRADG